jgi:hypothetical protein
MSAIHSREIDMQNIIFALVAAAILGTMFVATVATHPDGLPLA